MNASESDADTAICRECGREFLKRKFWQRDCSKDCHRKYQIRMRKLGETVDRAVKGAA